MNHTFVIGEAGSNHENKLATAFRLIDIAKWAGADACKFQYWSSSERLAARRNAPELAEMYERCRIPSKWLRELESCCDRVGIEFMCTAYLPEDIEVIAPLVKRFKVSSFEAGDVEFLEIHNRYQKQVFLSTGLMSENELIGSPNNWGPLFVLEKSAVILHCISSYPCSDSEVNLNGIKTVQRYWTGDFGRTPYSVGLSDHTKNPLTGALAVACGAKYIETHFRLNSTTPDSSRLCGIENTGGIENLYRQHTPS